MSITNVNLAMSASSYGAYNQKLTSATRSKLDALGIAYDSNITEQEGKQLLEKYESTKTQGNKSQSSFEDSNQDSKKEQLLILAKKVGAIVNEKESFEQIASAIEQKLEEKINSSQNDKEMLMELKNLSKELADLQNQNQNSNNFNSTNQALMMSLEMLSQYNKNFLNY